MKNYYYIGICTQRIKTLQTSACSYVNYVKRKGNCILVATTYILKHHMFENVITTSNNKHQQTNKHHYFD